MADSFDSYHKKLIEAQSTLNHAEKENEALQEAVQDEKKNAKKV